MSQMPDPKDDLAKDDKSNNPSKTKTDEKQQKSDPQLTELKGLIDPDEPIEVEGTDNPV